MGCCMEQDTIMDSDEIVLRDATITDEESGRFVQSRGKECPKCGSTRCGFVQGLAAGYLEPWCEESGVAIGFMCCADCRANWDAKYMAPRRDDDDEQVCPLCACENLGNGDGYIMLRDEFLEGYNCACGSKWYERWPLVAAEPPYRDDPLDNPDTQLVLGDGSILRAPPSNG